MGNREISFLYTTYKTVTSNAPLPMIILLTYLGVLKTCINLTCDVTILFSAA